MSWADIAIIALVVLFAMAGLWKGVQKSALSLGAFIVAFLIAFFLANVVAEALLNVEGVRRFVMDGEGFSLYTVIKKGLNPEASSEFLIKNYFTPIADIIAAYRGDVSAFNPYALYIAFTVFAAIVGVALFIVARLILCIVTMIIKSYIPRKKSAGNRAFGTIVGLVRGAVWAFVITVVFSTLGGLMFMPALDKAETEYEKSVVGKYFLQYAYEFKNATVLPDTDMFARLVNKSGFAVKPSDKPDEGDEGDEGDTELEAARNELCGAIYNLNYQNGFISYDPKTGDPVIEVDAKALSSADYAESGFDAAVLAITEYNAKMVAAVRNGAIASATVDDIAGYAAIIDDIYDIMYSGDANLVTTLNNYETGISAVKASGLVNPEVIAEKNDEFSAYYNTVKAALLNLESKYAELTVFAEADGVGAFALPSPLPEKYVYAPDAE